MSDSAVCWGVVGDMPRACLLGSVNEPAPAGGRTEANRSRQARGGDSSPGRKRGAIFGQPANTASAGRPGRRSAAFGGAFAFAARLVRAGGHRAALGVDVG